MYISFAALVLAFTSAQASAQEPPSAVFGTTVVVPGGLHGTVYFIPKNTAVLPDFQHDSVERVGEIWTDTLDIPPRHWQAGFPGLTKRSEWFAIDYEGRFWIDTPGRYTFALVSDDGSRLSIDDVPVIDNDCQHPPDIRIAAVRMGTGVHRIRVSYFQGPRDCISLVLAIAGPDHQWRVLDTTALKPPSDPGELQTSAASTIVPVTPAEASLGIKTLFDDLIRSDPKQKSLMDRKAGWGCWAAPVRSCSH